MKRTSVLASILFLALTSVSISAMAGPTWLLNVNGDYAKILSPASVTDGKIASGGAAIGYQWDKMAALDVNYQAESFSVGGNSISAGFAGLGMTFSMPQDDVTSGWLRLAARHKLGAEDSIGSWQGEAGAGVRFIAASYLAVDLGVQYRLTTPIKDAYSSVGGTLALVVPLGDGFGAAPVVEPMAKPAAAVAAPVATPVATPAATPVAKTKPKPKPKPKPTPAAEQ